MKIFIFRKYSGKNRVYFEGIEIIFKKYENFQGSIVHEKYALTNIVLIVSITD